MLVQMNQSTTVCLYKYMFVGYICLSIKMYGCMIVHRYIYMSVWKCIYIKIQMYVCINI